jgi:hypothetical protein
VNFTECLVVLVHVQFFLKEMVATITIVKRTNRNHDNQLVTNLHEIQLHFIVFVSLHVRP